MRGALDDLIDAATAERLLAGDVVGPRRLMRLLSQATAPARPHELRGEDAAMAAFRDGRRVTAPAAGRRLRAGAWARLVTVKAGAIALALTATGVALATGTGIIPSHLPGMAPAESSPSASANRAFPSTPHPGESRGDASQVGQTPPPSQSLDGLCRAYLAQVGTNRAKVLEDPMFGALVRAAGDTDKVPAFCEVLTHGASPGASTGAGKSGDHPTGPPTSRPVPPAHTPVPATHPDHENRPAT
jgi:hypothetical protein